MITTISHFLYTECDCNGGSSFNQSCNVISGQCPCKKGASSRQCDTCEPFYEIGDFGCQPCDNCTIKLLNTNSDINNTLISIDAKAVMATELQQADTLDLVTVQIRVAELYDLLDKTVGNLTEASNNLSRLNETKNNLTIDLSQQENLVCRCRKIAIEIIMQCMIIMMDALHASVNMMRAFNIVSFCDLD